MTHTPVNLDLSAFEGDWQLDRSVKNALGPDMHLTGIACFEARGDGLLLTERGTLRIDGQPKMEGEQRYIWRQQGQEIATFFADGRAFFQFSPTGQVAAAHWCSPDQYDVVMDFTRWPAWQAIWSVKGPRKDYEMTSLYRR